MRPTHHLSGWLALFVLFFCLPRVDAADDVVQQIPDNALAYVVVRNLREADREVNQTAQRMQLPAHNLLEMAKQSLGLVKGVVETGDLALVLMGSEAGGPYPVVFVRTDNFDELLGQLKTENQDGPISQVTVAGQSVLIAAKGKYAVLASPANRDGLKQVVASAASVKVDDGTQAFTQHADVYAVATNAGVKMLSQLAITGLQVVKQQLAQLGPQGDQAVAAFGMYEELLKWAAEEVKQVVVALRIDDNGAVSLVKRVDFLNPVEYADAGSAASATKRLARLPMRPYAIAGAGAMGDVTAMEKWMEFSMEMTRSMMGSQLSDEQGQKLIEISRKSMEGVRGVAFSFGVPEVGGSVYSGMAGIMEVDNADAYLARYVDTMQQMQQLFADSERMPYRILTAEKAEVAGVPGMKVVMQISPAALGPAAEQLKGMFDKLYGKDGKIEVYGAAIDDKHIALAYVSEDNLRALIQAAKSPDAGLAADEGIQITSKLLPENAQLVGFVSPAGTVQFIQRMVQAILPPEQQAQIPAFPSSPPLGFSFQYDGEALEAGLVAPAEFLTALGKYIQAVQQAAGR
ncbi:MAG: hypothetical protein ABI614_11220 [Planctomycetota bacterium]